MIREIGIGARDRLPAGQVLSLEGVTIGREHKFRLGPVSRGTCLQRCEGARDLAGGCDGDVDVVGLKDTAEVGLVGLALAEPLEGRFLVPEGLQEGEGKFPSVERPLGEDGYGLLDLNSVHATRLRPRSFRRFEYIEKMAPNWIKNYGNRMLSGG